MGRVEAGREFQFSFLEDDEFLFDDGIREKQEQEARFQARKEFCFAVLREELSLLLERLIAESVMETHPKGRALLYDQETGIFLQRVFREKKFRFEEITDNERFQESGRHKTFYTVVVLISKEDPKKISTETQGVISDLAEHLPKEAGCFFVLEPSLGVRALKNRRKEVCVAAEVQTEFEVVQDFEFSFKGRPLAYKLWEARHGKPIERDLLAQRHFTRVYEKEEGRSEFIKVDLEKEIEDTVDWFYGRGYEKVDVEELRKYLRRSPLLIPKKRVEALVSIWEGRYITATRQCGCYVTINKNGGTETFYCSPDHEDDDTLRVPNLYERRKKIPDGVRLDNSYSPDSSQKPRKKKRKTNTNNLVCMIDSQTGEETYVDYWTRRPVLQKTAEKPIQQTLADGTIESWRRIKGKLFLRERVYSDGDIVCEEVELD